jgi:hypothetical protein
VLTKQRVPSMQHSVQQSHKNIPLQSAISELRPQNPDGMDPLRSLPFTSKFLNDSRFANSDGTVPVIELSVKYIETEKRTM